MSKPTFTYPIAKLLTQTDDLEVRKEMVYIFHYLSPSAKATYIDPKFPHLLLWHAEAVIRERNQPYQDWQANG